MEHHDASVNGIRMHYLRAGSGPVLLFLHGFPQCAFAWEQQMAAFAGDYTVVAPDLRGYNLSDKPAALKDYRPAVLIEDLRQLLAHLGFERCHLVAHDWGGALAWNLAAASPQLIDKLVIINAPHPLLFARELRDNPAQQRASEYMLLLRSDKAERVLSEDGYRRLLSLFGDWDADAETLQRYRDAWAQPGALTGMLNYYRASPLHAPTATEPGVAALQLDPALFMVRVPTLVIWGERDTALLPGVLEGLEAYVPELRIERISAGSHWVVHEQPQRVSQLIAGFIG
jgi:pimeloyl-ACP methyl ester carboxylesterase